MPKEIYLVKVGMTMTEGTVEEWYIQDGVRVDKGAQLYRLETEKVNMDVDAESSGIVKHLVPAGTTLEPGDVIGWVYADGEPIPVELPSGKPNRAIDVVAAQDESQETTSEALTGLDTTTSSRVSSTMRSPKTRVAASPAARRLANQRNIDLEAIEGTGPRGRITLEDVEAASANNTSRQSGKTIALTGLRKTIARRMTESLQNSAQLTMSMEVSMDKCIELRSHQNEIWAPEKVRVAYTDLIAIATARALRLHPLLNSQLDGDQLQLMDTANIGIAVALPEGLIVPVIQDVNSKTLKQVAIESADLANRAREGKLSLEEVEGGTFTVSSLGMHGVDSFTPILNPPQTGIVGVGSIYDSVRWDAEKPVKVRKVKLSLTWDHRVVDGTPAANFLADIRDLLESPESLLKSS